MKTLLAAFALAASLAACATPYAPQEFDFTGLDLQPGVALGTVESVQAVAIERDIHAFEQVLELRLQPDLGERLVIRLDAGSAVTVTVKGAQRFEAGQRVRVVSETYGLDGPRVEHE
jgi:outer membrane lipoprotein SlyB